MKKLPDHLQKVLDKRAAKLKQCGVDTDPGDFLAECYKRAEAENDGTALVHGLAR